MFLGDWAGGSCRASLVVPLLVWLVFAVGLFCAVLRFVRFLCLNEFCRKPHTELLTFNCIALCNQGGAGIRIFYHD